MDSSTAILDHGYVKLVHTWGSDESIIEAARIYTRKGFQGWGSPEKVGDEKLLAYLYRHKHMTPFEMCGATFEVMAPIMVFREWHRHRTQSYNEMSARYIPLPDVNYVPDPFDVTRRSQEALQSKNAQARAAGEKPICIEEAQQWLADLREYYEAGQDLYERGLKLGVPKELARLPVTVGRYSRMRASANLRNWLQFLDLRATQQAQREIRLYAYVVEKMLQEKFPRTIRVRTEYGWKE